MKISIKRYSSENEPCAQNVEYALERENISLLEALNTIKTKTDPTLSFTAGCRSGVCGSCAVRVNGKEELACAYKLSEGDFIEPLNNLPVLRDLVVDAQKMLQFNALAKTWSSSNSKNRLLLPEQAEENALQSDCILCGACYSACPVYAVNENFIGPFALTRVWRYVSDSREQDVQEKIEAIQTNGIWDCTLCNLCVPVCPQGIAPKQDISMLRGKSGVMGFMDPNFSAGMNFGFSGGPDFGSPSF
jgi:fumarate reductase iron-sulfur subunit